MSFALFKDGEQVSKAHSTRLAAKIEAYERKIVVSCGTDFPDYGVHRRGHELIGGYEIKEIKE